MHNAKRQSLYRQGYRFIGNHSAIKVCEYCKKSLRDIDHCYKQKFYGIKSHRCIQMTPSLDFCNLRCKWCWRDIMHTTPKWSGGADNPAGIIDNCIKEHTKYIQGFKGFSGTNMRKFREALSPNQYAISLAGEPTLYPGLPELIKEIKKRGCTAFLVTNGTNPAMLKKLISKKEFNPTNLYITLPAPDIVTFAQCCRPLIEPATAWNNIMESLKIMSKFKSATAIRLTLVKSLNMHSPGLYAGLINRASPKHIEVKAYMWVGYSQKRLGIKDMPLHEEILTFARELVKSLPSYRIKSQKKESRVVLLARG